MRRAENQYAGANRCAADVCVGPADIDGAASLYRQTTDAGDAPGNVDGIASVIHGDRGTRIEIYRRRNGMGAAGIVNRGYIGAARVERERAAAGALGNCVLMCIIKIQRGQ